MLRWLRLFSRRIQNAHPSGKKPPKKRKLQMEPLEDRAVPAVFNVNSLADTLTPPAGVVTLRSAIQAANATPGGNTINLTLAGTYNITIPGAANDTNATGDFDILATGGNLSIVNTSGGQVTVNGNKLDRVFDINPTFNAANPTPAFTVTMQGFTITGGLAQPGDAAGGSGGGIRDQGNASLTLTNMTVTNNNATADGGGVAMENTVSTPWTLTVNNSTISNNHAGDAGGGIDTDGSGKVFVNAGSQITGNTTVNQGAGIWLDAIQAGNVFQGANLTVNGATINNNVAQSAGGIGGGVGNAGNGSVLISNSTMNNNVAGANGGGFGDENAQGNFTLVNSVVNNNRATTNGGGISTGGPITSITSSEIDGNSSGMMGGAVFANGTQLTVQSTTMANNNAAGNGGGIELETTGAGAQGSSIVNSTISGNNALNNAGTNGGGVDIAPTFTGSLKLLNDTINNNFASNGGGVFYGGAGNVSVQNTIIAKNAATTAPDVSTNQLFTANLNGAQQVPPTVTPGTGTASIVFNPSLSTINVNLASTGLIGTITAQHLHIGAAGANGPVAKDVNGANIDLGTTNPTTGTFTVDNNAANNPGGFINDLQNGNVYTNIHTTTSPNGEIRGQFTMVGGTFTDAGGNLIGTAGMGNGTTSFTTASTQAGTTGAPIDPLLSGLANNGGPTLGSAGNTMVIQTAAPMVGSPAIGKGVVTNALPTDERGQAAIFNGKINVGSVSVGLQPVVPPPVPPPGGNNGGNNGGHNGGHNGGNNNGGHHDNNPLGFNNSQHEALEWLLQLIQTSRFNLRHH
jgi:hypothetical protein